MKEIKPSKESILFKDKKYLQQNENITQEFNFLNCYSLGKKQISWQAIKFIVFTESFKTLLFKREGCALNSSQGL